MLGTRITVYNLLPHFLDPAMTEAEFCRFYELTPEHVAAARAYLLNNAETVLENGSRSRSHGRRSGREMHGLLADVNVQGHLPYLRRLLEALNLWPVIEALNLHEFRRFQWLTGCCLVCSS